MKTFTSGSAAVQLRKMNTELKICWNCTWEADEAVILRCLIVVSSVAQKYRGWLGPRTMEEPVYFNIIQGCFAVIFAIAPRRRKDARCPNQVRDAYFLSLWKFHCTIIGIIDHLEFKKDAAPQLLIGMWCIVMLSLLDWRVFVSMEWHDRPFKVHWMTARLLHWGFVLPNRLWPVVFPELSQQRNPVECVPWMDVFFASESLTGHLLCVGRTWTHGPPLSSLRLDSFVVAFDLVAWEMGKSSVASGRLKRSFFFPSFLVYNYKFYNPKWWSKVVHVVQLLWTCDNRLNCFKRI